MKAHYRGWRLQNEHLRVLTESRIALTFLGLQHGQFSLKEFEAMIRICGPSLKSLHLGGSFVVGDGSVSSLMVKNCPQLESYFAPEV